MTKTPQYRFEVFRSPKDQKFYWHLLAEGNTTIFAASGGDGYEEKAGCLRGIELVKVFASGAAVFDKTSCEEIRIHDIGDLVKRLLGS